MEIVVYEPSPKLGHGIAYARSPDHFLLNVPAHGLACSTNGNGDFLDWALRSHTDSERFREDDGSYYFPRSWFGRYVENSLNEARTANSDRIRFIHSQCVVNAMALLPEGVEISSRSNAGVFDHAILAIGNAPSRPLAVDAKARHCPKVVQSAWALPEAEIDRDAQVIIVGSGLTMADAIGELEARSHRGNILCISRHGQLHHCGSGSVPEFIPPFALTAGSASQLLRQIRAWIAFSMKTFGDWRPVIDHLRRNSPQVWRLLDKAEQGRLKKHARLLWEIHRFQMPPAAYRRIEAMRVEGRFTHISATAVRVEEGGLRVAQADRQQILPADLIINATGFDSTYKTAPAALEDLIAHPAIDLNAVRRSGLSVSDTGELLALSGDQRLFALGYIARGNHGELSTVNALGAVAEALADHMSALQTIQPTK